MKKDRRKIMATIEEIGARAVEFVKEILRLADARVLKAARGESGWEIEVEVFEESSFIKSLGLPTRVRDRNVYRVVLDDELNILSYERKET
jgi:hypothetical protein